MVSGNRHAWRRTKVLSNRPILTSSELLRRSFCRSYFRFFLGIGCIVGHIGPRQATGELAKGLSHDTTLTDLETFCYRSALPGALPAPRGTVVERGAGRSGSQYGCGCGLGAARLRIGER